MASWQILPYEGGKASGDALSEGRSAHFQLDLEEFGGKNQSQPPLDLTLKADVFLDGSGHTGAAVRPIPYCCSGYVDGRRGCAAQFGTAVRQLQARGHGGRHVPPHDHPARTRDARTCTLAP